MQTALMGIWHVSDPKCGVMGSMVKACTEQTPTWVEGVRQAP